MCVCQSLRRDNRRVDNVEEIAMTTPLSTIARRVGALATLVLLASCTQLPLQAADNATPPPCPEGHYALRTQTLDVTLPAPFGQAHVATLAGDQLALDVTSTSWTLSGSQHLSVSGQSPFGTLDGDLGATVHADGSWTETSPGAIDFTAGHLTGTGTFTGSVGGLAITRSGSLADLGLAATFGFSGSANFTCGGSPDLALTFSSPSITLQFDRK